MKPFTVTEIRDLLNQVYHEEISFSRMVEIMNERVSEFKDGDFVVGPGCIFIVHRQLNNYSAEYYVLYAKTNGKLWYDKIYWQRGGIDKSKLATEAEKQEFLDALAKEGKRWNAEKKCVEDIPQRKFKAGDKVKIKDGISSKTHSGVGPSFVDTMDKFIGEELTVKEYSSRGWVVFYGDVLEYEFAEDWLEPYVEELKEGDLAIFWMFDKTQAAVRLFDNEQGDISQLPIYVDNTGHWWANAIKFESKEQYEKLLKGEI